MMKLKMNFYQILAGLFIIFIVFLRSMTVKMGTKNFSSKQITFANYFYMVVALCLTIPFMKDMLIPVGYSNWWVGIVVGVVLLIAVLAVIFIVLNKRRRLKMISNGINIKLGRK